MTYDVCLDSLPYFIGSVVLVIIIARLWEFATDLMAGR